MNFTKAITIATHNGSFHADEALAVFMLKQLYASATLVRTRDPALIASADIVVDVGAVYDPSTHRYDHHQREFTTTFSASHNTTKLSSAGLVYKHFGIQVLQNIFVESIQDESVIETVYQKVYTDFIEGMDAIDNGVSQYDSPQKYKESTNLSRRVSRLNPSWNDPCQDNLDERFLQAVEIVGKEFLDIVRDVGLSWIPARGIVEKGISERFSVHASGKIVVLEQFCPWKEHLYALEKEVGAERVLYVLYSDQSGKWRVQAVPESEDSFASRLALPDAWRGLRDEQLSEMNKIAGCIFVHASGFIGGNATREGAVEMAIKSLEV